MFDGVDVGVDVALVMGIDDALGDDGQVDDVHTRVRHEERHEMPSVSPVSGRPCTSSGSDVVAPKIQQATRPWPTSIRPRGGSCKVCVIGAFSFMAFTPCSLVDEGIFGFAKSGGNSLIR